MRDAIIFGIGLITGAVATPIFKMEKINGPVWYAEDTDDESDKSGSSSSDNQKD